MEKGGEYDWIVVGSGTAGSVVASRLAVSGQGSVLLLEAGPKDSDWRIEMPAAYGKVTQEGPYNWGFYTTPQNHLNGRQIFQPRGKVLGGSSSINGMVFIRGHALDFERWAAMGAAGWSWADVLPYFKRMETYVGTLSKYRGTDGPLTITKGNASHPINAAFLEAGEQGGWPFTDDINGYQQEGFSFWDRNTKNGVRVSGPKAYIRGIAANSRALTVKTAVRVLNIEFEKGRAVGVRCSIGGKVVVYRASRETILSAGAVHSPQMLMLSGIGPAQHLRQFGIDVRVDLPGVGENLQDHPYVGVQYASKKPITLNRHIRPDRLAMVGMKWFLAKAGPAASNSLEVGALLKSDPSMPYADAQLHFKPVLLEGWNVSKRHGYNFGVGTLRCTSVGTLRLASANPLDAPLIDPNYLATPEDVVDMRNTIKLTREVAYQKAFDEFRDFEVAPGKDVRTDAEIDAFVRQNLGSGFHPSCTCRMGQDEMAVTTPELKVRGVEGLRIIDTSVFPFETTGNTNAPTFMVGERGADLVLGKTLPPEPLPAADMIPREYTVAELNHPVLKTENWPVRIK